MTVNPRRELRHRLTAIAGAQSGYFSAAQARAAGYSYEAALSVHELGDVNPARTHLTVPKGFRQHPPAGVVLHQGVLPEGDVRDQEGFRVTTPLRSLLDTAAGDLDLDLLA